MTVQVEVTVTSFVRGTGPVVPYNSTEGLQVYLDPRGIRTSKPVVYDVPTYAVVIGGGRSYQAIRFGLRNDGRRPPPERPCDTGLGHERVCYPQWVPNYSPHSFQGGIRRGAWRLIPGQNFLIHEGANRMEGQVGGSIGCVEILDGRWNEFLEEIEALGKGTCAQLAAAHHVKVSIQRAPWPNATLRP